MPIALGNDGMGSLRIPAANCGLVTIKPGLGVVPAGIGEGDWFGMSENGPLATTVEDARLMLSVLADTGFARRDADPPRTGSPSRCAARSPGSPSASRTRRRPGRRPELLMKAGHQVRRADPPYPLSLSVTSLAHWTAGTAVDARDLDRRLLTRRTRVHAAVGRRFVSTVGSGAGPGGAAAAPGAVLRGARRAAHPDARPPLPQGRAWHERGWLRNVLANTNYSPLTPPWNLTGWPAMSVPFGTLPSGAPCAVQLVGRPGSEADLLAVAEQLEERRPWQRTAPLD